MSEDVPSAPVFAPSELVILFGDRFAPEAGLLGSKEEILTSGVKVSSEKLMNAAIKAALYTVHRSGAAKLQPRAGKALFGLMNTQKLFWLQGPGSASFPAGSLEAYLVEAAVMEQEVENVLKAFIGEESSNPPQRALGLMKRGMSERGMLEAEMKKTMMVFTTIDYVLPATTRMAAEAESIAPIQQLLREFEQREPELDKAVQKDIDAARVSMTESSD
ncbi:hypothetical protein [Longimicrobium sp.]|uniref:hypothetical protein n=1 Tax=Longimicrobium sp. TaxID=2029185 RepID=UPI003B3B811A